MIVAITIIIIVAIFASALLHFSAFGAMVRYRHVKVLTNQTYVPGSTNPKQALDVYLPQKTSSSFPMVLFIHGGYWVSGDRNYHGWLLGLYGSIGRVFAYFGIGTAVMSYRLSPEVAIDGQYDDVRAAKQYVIDHAASWGASDRLFVMGHSAGGHLASLLYLREPSGLSGCIALSPILDVADMVANQSAAFNESVSYPVFGRDPATWAANSPGLLLHDNPERAKRLSLFVAEHDFTYLKRRALSIGHPVTVMPRFNHMMMVTAFGKQTNRLAKTVASIVHGMK